MKIRGLAKRFLTALAVLTLTAEGLAAPLSILAAGSMFFLAQTYQRQARPARLAVLGLVALALVVPT